MISETDKIVFEITVPFRRRRRRRLLPVECHYPTIRSKRSKAEASKRSNAYTPKRKLYYVRVTSWLGLCNFFETRRVNRFKASRLEPKLDPSLINLLALDFLLNLATVILLSCCSERRFVAKIFRVETDSGILFSSFIRMEGKTRWMRDKLRLRANK